MNNKILARVVAALMAVMMLGTVSFAAEKDITATEPTYTGQKTVLAFIAESGKGNDTTYSPADAEIVAVDQLADGAPYPTKLNIADDKLANTTGKSLYVRFGSEAGTVKTTEIALAADAQAPHLMSISAAATATINGTTYENVVYAKYAIPMHAGYTLDKYGVAFGRFSGTPTVSEEGVFSGTAANGADGQNAASIVDVKATSNTLIEGAGGTVSFEAIILNVAVRDINALQAYGYATYKKSAN